MTSCYQPYDDHAKSFNFLRLRGSRFILLRRYHLASRHFIPSREGNKPFTIPCTLMLIPRVPALNLLPKCRVVHAKAALRRLRSRPVHLCALCHVRFIGEWLKEHRDCEHPKWASFQLWDGLGELTLALVPKRLARVVPHGFGIVGNTGEEI